MLGLWRAFRHMPTRVPPAAAAAPEAVVNALRGFRTARIQVGSHTFQLDRAGMTHILERHHPSYWAGERAKVVQSFFARSTTIDQIVNSVRAVMTQRRAEILAAISRGDRIFSVEGEILGVRYQLGLNNGRVGQLFPIVPD